MQVSSLCPQQVVAHLMKTHSWWDHLLYLGTLGGSWSNIIYIYDILWLFLTQGTVVLCVFLIRESRHNLPIYCVLDTTRRSVSTINMQRPLCSWLSCRILISGPALTSCFQDKQKLIIEKVLQIFYSNMMVNMMVFLIFWSPTHAQTLLNWFDNFDAC